MKICYVGDLRSVHTRRWVGWFARTHEVSMIRTCPDDGLEGVAGFDLPQGGRWPGHRLTRSISEVERILRLERPDVVHAHYINEAGWLAACARWRPFVLTAWGSDVYRAPRESWLARVLNPWAARQADFVTCDSQDQRRELEAWGVAASRLGVIGWGVDTSAFSPAVDGRPWRSRLEIPESAAVVLSPRQWLPNSQIASVVAAFERLTGDPYLILKRLSRFEDDHAGDVEGAVESSPASNRIRVVDEIPEGDLPGLYAAADCVVSLCVTDGTPVSILEAMATGCPVVAQDNASLREWISPPGGVLVSDGRPERVAFAIETLISDQARKRAARRHNVSVVGERADRSREMARMEDVYRLLLTGRGGPIRPTVTGAGDAAS